MQKHGGNDINRIVLIRYEDKYILYLVLGAVYTIVYPVL